MPKKTQSERRPSEREPRWLTAGVASVGATSFLSDSGHEMVTSVLPAFVTGMLGGSAAALGVIEGCADALTGLCKLAGGPAADDPRGRQRLASGGYTTTAIATAAIGLATAVWQVGVLRAVSWAARGFRSPARDALLADLAHENARGRAYGVERAGDNIGAVVGPLLGGVLVAWVGLRTTILLSVIPGLLAAVAIVFAARQARHLYTEPAIRRRMRDGYRRLRGTGIGRALIPAALFEGGNLAATLLILRANQLLIGGGMGAVAAISLTTALYAAFNAAAAIVAIPAGHLVDRVGARPVLAGGAASYVIAYLGFAFVSPTSADGAAWWLLGCFVLGGLGIGLGETSQSTLGAGAVLQHLRGSAFGLFGLVQAGGDVAATLVGGVLFTLISPAACFGYAAVWMVASAVTASTLRVPRSTRLDR